ncbi:FKBP-type peptidyl-prolyl cis-trans isomerase N-terminal domain-containing protein [candidate division KSB1 bacterium]
MKTGIMKLTLFALMAVMMLFPACQQGEVTIDKNSDVDKDSFALGYNQGFQFYNQGFAEHIGEVNYDAFAKGYKEGLEGALQSLTEEELNQALANLNTRISAGIMAKQEEEALNTPENATVKAESETFLRENAQREGVVVLDTGVQYEVLKEGSGDVIGNNAVVKAHYKLSFPGGDVWQDSHETGMPFELDLSSGQGAILGWLETIPLMKMGSVWNLYLPHNKAYGPQGRGQIKPFQALVFEIEIVEVTQK